MAAAAREAVQVVVRCRPLSKDEQAKHRKIVDVDERSGQVRVAGHGTSAAVEFTFDQVFGDATPQLELFRTSVEPIVRSVMEGFNGTIFAYGQTGTGKTYTMEGVLDKDQPGQRGVMPNAFDCVCDTIDAARGAGTDFCLAVTYLEIYQERVYDLLEARAPGGERGMQIGGTNEAGFEVKGLTPRPVSSAEDMETLLREGKGRRKTAAQAMNAESSRSHAVFTVHVERSDDAGGVRMGKLRLVDLAGSERNDKTGAVGTLAREGAAINTSLTVLGNVIEALVAKKAVVPYRESALTKILKDSLGGNTKTVMIANIGPASYNAQETRSTLTWANRAKKIQNKPTKNVNPKDAKISEFKAEIERLKRELAQRGGAQAGGAAPGQSTLNDARVAEVRERIRAELLESMRRDSSAEATAAATAAAEARCKEQLEAIMSQADATAAQKAEAAALLQQQHAELALYAGRVKAELSEKRRLEGELAAAQARVIVDGENMVDRVSKLKQQLQECKIAEKVQRRQQEELQRRMEEQEVESGRLESDMGARKLSLEKLQAQLKRLFVMYRGKKSERDSLGEALQHDRDALLAEIREVQRDVKLKDLLIAAYIPPAHQERIMAAAAWDEGGGAWVVQGMQVAGNVLREERDLAASRKAHAEAARRRREEDDPHALEAAYFTYKELEALRAQHMEAQAAAAARPGSRASVKA